MQAEQGANTSVANSWINHLNWQKLRLQQSTENAGRSSRIVPSLCKLLPGGLPCPLIRIIPLSRFRVLLADPDGPCIETSRLRPSPCLASHGVLVRCRVQRRHGGGACMRLLRLEFAPVRRLLEGERHANLQPGCTHTVLTQHKTTPKTSPLVGYLPLRSFGVGIDIIPPSGLRILLADPNGRCVDTSHRALARRSVNSRRDRGV